MINMDVSDHKGADMINGEVYRQLRDGGGRAFLLPLEKTAINQNTKVRDLELMAGSSDAIHSTMVFYLNHSTILVA
jgi:hypothetical protein|tara:strand:- start:628 stop:855 length:228 start_codon:yes stop_codon:yes gene_type:complete